MRQLGLLRREQGQAAANSMIAQGEGIRLMEEIRSLGEEMKAEENGLLAARKAESRASARKANVVITLGTLLALAFVLGASQITRRDSAQRRQAELLLRESEAELKQAQRVAHLGSWHMVTDTGQVTWSEELYRMLGLDPALPPPPYQDHHKLFTRESWERLSAALDKTARAGVPYELELETVRADGGKGWMLARGEAECDAKGAVTGLHGVALDITGRKQAQEAVKAERQRFNDVLDMLPAYVVLLSPDYHVPFANRYFREHFGESHGRRCYEYLFNRTEPCESCETFTVLKTREPHHWEWTGPDGHNYDISDFPFTDIDGSTLIMEMGIDVTERKQAETALRESEALTTSIVDSTSDLIWSVDPETFGLLTFNPGLRDYFLQRRGIRLQTGMDPDQLLPNKEFADRWRGFYRRALSEGSFTIDYEAVGSTILQLTLNPLEREGKVFGISVFGKDITERTAGGGGTARERNRLSHAGGVRAADGLDVHPRRFEHLFQPALGGLHRADSGRELWKGLEHALPPRRQAGRMGRLEPCDRDRRNRTRSRAACARPMAAIAGFSCGACPCAMPRDTSPNGSAPAPISTT